MNRLICLGLFFCVTLFPALTVTAGQAVFEGQEPLLWQQEPHASVSHRIRMSVQNNDRGGLEYLFDCIEGDAPDSGWQTSSAYEINALKPGTTYTFVAKVRDKATGRSVAADMQAVQVVTPTADETFVSTHGYLCQKWISTVSLTTTN